MKDVGLLWETMVAEHVNIYGPTRSVWPGSLAF